MILEICAIIVTIIWFLHAYNHEKYFKDVREWYQLHNEEMKKIPLEQRLDYINAFQRKRICEWEEIKTVPFELMQEWYEKKIKAELIRYEGDIEYRKKYQ